MSLLERIERLESQLRSEPEHPYRDLSDEELDQQLKEVQERIRIYEEQHPNRIKTNEELELERQIKEVQDRLNMCNG
jgi:hypothetical protein